MTPLPDPRTLSASEIAAILRSFAEKAIELTPVAAKFVAEQSNAAQGDLDDLDQILHFTIGVIWAASDLLDPVERAGGTP